MLLLAGALHAPSPASAQASTEKLIIGAWPDITLTGGGGIGLGNSLDANVFAKLRLGLLYAHEPVIANLGITGEVGALAERGVGAELELSHFGGPWIQVGASRVLRAQWMGQLTLGFAWFGVEWQHRFGENSDALLFLLRAPIGLWWFLHQNQEARARRRESTP